MKLTNAMKDRIIKNIMDDTFNGRKSALESEQAKLADDIYEEFYGEHGKKMASLPECFFIAKSSLEFKLPCDRFSRTMVMTTTRLFGSCHNYSSINVKEGSVFIEKAKNLEEKISVFNSDMTKLRNTLQSVIRPITTDKRLAEVWPDAAKWIPTTPAAMMNLPAIRPEDLNALVSAMKG